MNDHDRALAVLERDGFTKGFRTNPATGGHCGLGCYYTALQELGLDLETFENRKRLDRAFIEFAHAAGIEMKTDTGIRARMGIVGWNDHPDRIAADLREAFKKASEAHELGA